jgi:hypothetical protein
MSWILPIFLAIFFACMIACIGHLLGQRRQLQEKLAFKEEELDRANKYHWDIREMLIDQHMVVKKDLEARLKNAFTCLELALAAVPSQFNNVNVELGLQGVTYQFHSLDKETIS